MLLVLLRVISLRVMRVDHVLTGLVAAGAALCLRGENLYD
jgi:hypothetical protein